MWNQLVYGLSLPERAVRATGAVVGGALRESANLLVPRAFRTSKSYSIFVQQAFDFLAENVGGVERASGTPASPTEVDGYLARKAVGNFVELAGLATFHLSPLTILAIVSDVAYGSQTFLQELSTELKRQGMIPEDSTIDHASDLLRAVQDASGTAASAFDVPPLSVEGLQLSIEQTRAAVGRIDPTRLLPQAEIERIWKEMREVADKQQVGLFEVSSAMTLFAVRRIGDVGGGALSTVRVAGNLFDRHILEHYSESLRTIRDQGYYETLSEVAKPYHDAVWRNFSVDRGTITADLLTGRSFGQAWRGITGWLSGSSSTTSPEAEMSSAAALSAAAMSASAAAAAAMSFDQHDDSDWQVEISPGLAGLMVAHFSIRGAQITPSTAEQLMGWQAIVQPVISGDAEGGDERLQAIRGLLRRSGFKPSGRSKPAQEYLIGVLRRDGALPAILNAVDGLNAVSTASGLPISMLSLNRTGRHWRVRAGKQNESFVFNSGGQTIDVEGAIVIEGDLEDVTERGAVGSPIKDSAWGKICETDREFGVLLYASDETIDEPGLRRWAELLAIRLAQATGGTRSKTRIITA